MDKIYKAGRELTEEFAKTELPYGSVAIWNIGQVGTVIKGKKEGGFIVIDPYLTHSIEENHPGTEFVREYEPPIDPEGLKGAAGILVTHFHDDHLDLSTIRGIQKVSPETTLAVPASHLYLVEDIVEREKLVACKDGESFHIHSFKITPIASSHTIYEKDEEGNHFYLGFFIECNGVKLYHSGDTVVTDELVERVRAFQPDIAFLPINGADYFRTARGIVGNMNFREAADFGVAIGADLIIPNHYDLFPNNRDNPAYFVDYLFQHYRKQKFHMLAVGERFIYMK
ncbi:MBL fold metallo-hydrolase [Thermoflavimicrobium dichotomicum]|uniref:MBL fold metallo-hydrolase n=1 Tax=Thermoflavimicrobium dichotomicum TaxID=46223 RepID=UPI001587057F|nr:MBL fold metallo-hydrolase [Thermoflavimicrobium dichotomicum]